MKNDPQISVVIITLNSEVRIPYLIKSLQRFADEIIVGVDSRTTDNTYNVSKEVATSVVWIDNEEDGSIAEEMLDKIWPYTTKEWVLRLDDDEFISNGFYGFKKNILPNIKADFIAFPRKWVTIINNKLFFLNQKPLFPDYQNRMIRREKAVFDKTIHTPGFKITGEVKFIDEVCIFHLDWVYNSYIERLEKTIKYESQGKGLGLSNYYLYEDFYNKDDEWIELDKSEVPEKMLVSIEAAKHFKGSVSTLFKLNIDSFKSNESQETIQKGDRTIMTDSSDNESNFIDLNLENIKYSLEQAQNYSNVGTDVPQMLHFGYIKRKIARFTAKILLYFLQIITNQQRSFNNFIDDVLQGMMNIFRRTEHHLNKMNRKNMELLNKYNELSKSYMKLLEDFNNLRKALGSPENCTHPKGKNK